MCACVKLTACIIIIHSATTRPEKVITNLRDDVRRLSEELQRKDVLLSSYIDTAAAQNKKIAVLNSVINTSTADTFLWDPLQTRPSSCSTPNPEGNWTEVIVRGGGKARITDIPPPLLHLSNRYTALTEAPDHPGEDGRACVVPDCVSNGASPNSMHRSAASPPAGGSGGKVGAPDGAPLHNSSAAAAPTTTGPCSAPYGVGESSCGGPGSSCVDSPSRSPSQHLDRGASWSEVVVRERRRTSNGAASVPHPAVGPQRPPLHSSARRKRLLQDAVRLHTRGSPHLAGNHAPGSPTSPPGHLMDPPPTTLIIGDSIVRSARMRGAITLSFPGATVAEITERIPGILKSHPQADRLIIHAATNDIPKQQSELLKQDFTHLFNLVKQSQLSVFISVPTPTCGRLLSVNTWLSSASSSHNVGFIDNFDVFWERRHLFGADGLHLNKSGCRLLSTNLAYSAQHARNTFSSH
ncbi:hypothetical protein ABVT39_022101 [Epinephelus coioides]